MTSASSALEPVACPVCDNATRFAPVRSARIDFFIDEMDVSSSRSSWVTCRDCGMVLQNPRPNAAAHERLYRGGGYHVMAHDLVDDKVHVMKHRFQHKIDQISRLYPGGNVAKTLLDVGCGIGEALVLARDAGFQVRGVQPDAASAEVARTRFGLDVSEGLFDIHSFPDRSFGVVFSNHVMEHVEHPLRVAQAMAQVLVPGGLCIAWVPTYYRNRSWTARGWMNACHNWLFTHHTLGTLLARAGLQPVEHVYGDADEVCVIARRHEELVPYDREARLATHPSWEKVKRYHDVMIDARAVAYMPWQIGRRARKFAEITGGDPKEIAAYVRRMVEYRTGAAKRLVKSVLPGGED